MKIVDIHDRGARGTHLERFKQQIPARLQRW